MLSLPACPWHHSKSALHIDNSRLWVFPQYFLYILGSLNSSFKISMTSSFTQSIHNSHYLSQFSLLSIILQRYQSRLQQSCVNTWQWSLLQNLMLLVSTGLMQISQDHRLMTFNFIPDLLIWICLHIPLRGPTELISIFAICDPNCIKSLWNIQFL